MTKRKTQPGRVHLPPFKVNKVVSSFSEVQQWGIRQLRVPEVWKETQGEGITVMVIDTGCTNHTDLQGAILTDKCKTFVDGEDIYDTGSGHSTHCAGIIGARQNDMGCVGVAPKCNIITVKVLGKDGTGSQASVNAGLEYALIIKPDIVSMSLGSPNYDKTEENIIKKLYDLNIPVVAAAGNEGGKRSKTNTVNYPGKLEQVITVAATNEDGTIADYSSWGAEVDIAAPGSNIYSTYLRNSYANLSGTSMACPLISGVVALMLAKHRKQEKETGLNDCKTVDQIKQHLYKYATDKGEIGFDNSFGYGLVNPVKSIIENTIIPEPIKEPKLGFWDKIKRFFSKLFN